MAVGVTNTQIQFKLDDRKLTLDYRKVPFSAWGELKKATGFTQTTLIKALGDSDLDAVVALIWLERKQRERKLRYLEAHHDLEHAKEDTDFEVLQIVLNGRAWLEDDKDDEDEGDEEDPTGGS